MFPPEKILFPVDFSERCTAAARMAETFAGHFQAELTLLHVVEPLTCNDVPADLNALGERQLSGYLVEELKQLDVKRVLLHGDPSSQILEYAQSRNFDLIMLPTHGYGKFRRLILGSVTGNVLHEALCPVWTGVHMEQVPRLEDIAFRKILCALDLGPQSCPALSWAKKIRVRIWSRPPNCPCHPGDHEGHGFCGLRGREIARTGRRKNPRRAAKHGIRRHGDRAGGRGCSPGHLHFGEPGEGRSAGHRPQRSWRLRGPPPRQCLRHNPPVTLPGGKRLRAARRRNCI